MPVSLEIFVGFKWHGLRSHFRVSNENNNEQRTLAMPPRSVKGDNEIKNDIPWTLQNALYSLFFYSKFYNYFLLFYKTKPKIIESQPRRPKYPFLPK